jgi:hypothetical protein
MTIRLTMVVVAGLGILAAQPVRAATPPALTVEYAADRKIETAAGDMQGRVHATPNMQRNETRVGDMTSVMILRTDKKIGWMLMPAQKMYQQLDLDKAGKQTGAVTPEQTELELVGKETVSGQLANKYKFVTKDKSSGGFLWYTDSGIPVKMDALSKSGGKSERMTVTLENVTIGKQDPALFEVPAGYTKLPSAGLAGGGMSGGGLLGGLKNAVTRPVKNEATGVANDAAALENAPAQAVEAEVTEEVQKTGARKAVRGALRSLGGMLR